MLNAFLALRFRQPDYPTCLSEYLVQAIGVTIVLPGGAKIAPDVITSRVEANLTLLVEIKGGRDFDGDQLARMLRATPGDLRDLAYLPVRDEAAHRVHIAYVCNEEIREDFAHQAGACASVIGFDGARFCVSGVPLPDATLTRCLTTAPIAAGAIPLAIVPFDRESPEEEVARAIIPHVVEALVQGTGTVTDELIVSKTHPLVKSAMTSTGSGSELAEVVKLARRALDDLAAGELSEWLERARNLQPPMWRLLKTLPIENRTRELQKLRRAAEQYLERKGAKRGVQLTMFDEV